MATTDISSLTTAIINLNKSINYKMFKFPFDGKNKSKTSGWVEECSKASDLLNLDDLGKITALYQNAEGGLSSFIKRWVDTTETEKTFAELKKSILANFSNTPDPATALDQLRHIKQERDEPVSLFAERIFLLATDCFPETDLNNDANRNFAQQQLIHYFIQGLANNNIRFKVLSSHPNTLTKAVQIARDQINLLNSFHATNNNHEHSNIRYDSDAMDTTPAPTNYVRRSRRPILNINNTAQTRRNPIVCWWCSSPGHLQNDCPHKNRNTGFRRGYNGYNRPQTSHGYVGNGYGRNNQGYNHNQNNSYRNNNGQRQSSRPNQNNNNTRPNTFNRQQRYNTNNNFNNQGPKQTKN